ncbi:MAG TPA: hypothetical protein VH143_11395 [Kofleriaceae bacterium]|nr:hypothetical protein [Kofleriaceae bacterium]
MSRIATLVIAAAGCLPHPGGFSDAAPESVGDDASFSAPQSVSIIGYGSDVMEPFVTRDGAYLLFNDRNDPATDTNLFYATSIDATEFQFAGPIAGANSTSLDGVASVDDQGELVFVSTRSYAQSLSTLYTASFAAGVATGVALIPGVSRDEATVVNFDAEISADGSALYFVDGVIDPGASLPSAADLVIADRTGSGFARRPDSAAIFANINSSALEYAPATTSDQLELFFDRFDPSVDTVPAIYHATRATIDEPFGAPAKLAALGDNLVEGATVSPDGKAVYYHQLDGDRYDLYRVTRAAPASLRAPAR